MGRSGVFLSDLYLGVAARLRRRRLAPLGQLREALATHNARLNANNSDICCSTSPKASTSRKIDFAETGIKYPHRNGSIKLQNYDGVRTRLVMRHLRILSLRTAAPYGRFIRKSSSFLPDRSCATSQRGCFPRPAQVSLRFFGLRYLGTTFG
jgi:hypothetical protein